MRVFFCYTILMKEALPENLKSSRLWFKRKTYGWGWTPATWQGWFIVLLFIAIFFLNAWKLSVEDIAGAEPSRGAFLLFFARQLFAVILLIVICYKKGEKPRWQWGTSSEHEAGNKEQKNTKEHTLIVTTENMSWVMKPNIVKTFLADTIPDVGCCTSAYAFVFKDSTFLQTDLRDGEREGRTLDIPGGHIDPGETPEQAVVRETFEETGVRVSVRNLVGYQEVTLTAAKPDNYRYPYPKSYMAFYLCDIVEETPFEGNDDTHGRVWLAPEMFETSSWCVDNKIFLEEIIKIM